MATTETLTATIDRPIALFNPAWTGLTASSTGARSSC
ncbi:MAG: hypothetical protein RJA55_231 [Acidobacteriota bacterium]|jgi:hypothetical protein